MLMITGYLKADPGEVRAFLADLRAGIPRTHGEDGCLFYDFALVDADAGLILGVERWRDQASLDAHLATPESQALIAKWGARISFDVKAHDATNERTFG